MGEKRIMTQITREAVIDASCRHVKGEEHDNEDLCIFCADEYVCPNPFIDINMPTALAYHGRAVKEGKPIEGHCLSGVCVICNPLMAKMEPDYWEEAFPKWKREALKRRIQARSTRGKRTFVPPPDSDSGEDESD